MATCKDCIHHDLCDAKGHLILTINDICELEYRSDVSEWWCKHFKPTADVAPKSKVDMSQHLLKDAYKRIEELDELCGELQKAKAEVAREIFEEIEEALQYEIDLEDKYGRNAWGQGDVSAFQTHEYTEDKLETIQIALSLLKKKYTEERDERS